VYQNTDFLRHLSILTVWGELGGGPVKHGRAKAFWRKGNGWSVSLDAEKNCWYDFVSASGGGILALVETALGCSRVEALRWARDFAGVPVCAEAKRRAEANRWRAAIPEGRAMAAWFERILEGLDEWHLLNFRLYHHAKRCILNGRYASDEELCALMDEAERSEAEWQLAERVRDVLRAASADDLLVIFRAEAKSAEARTR
jgi:hypothetical protein